MTKTLFAAAAFAVAAMETGTVAQAAEIKVLCASALRSAMTELFSAFETSSGHKVIVEFGPVGPLKTRIQDGDVVDVAILSGALIDDLEKKGKITAGSRVNVAKIGLSGGVRKGVPRFDIGSVDAFKRTLLAANSIGYIDPASGGASGIYMAALLERLGIAPEIKSKTKLFAPGGPLSEAIAKGDVEIGFDLTTVLALKVDAPILAASTIDLVGKLRAEIQNYSLFAAGIGERGRQPEVIRALIKFITSPDAIPVLKAKGIEPG